MLHLELKAIIDRIFDNMFLIDSRFTYLTGDSTKTIKSTNSLCNFVKREVYNDEFLSSTEYDMSDYLPNILSYCEK